MPVAHEPLAWVDDADAEDALRLRYLAVRVALHLRGRAAPRHRCAAGQGRGAGGRDALRRQGAVSAPWDRGPVSRRRGDAGRGRGRGARESLTGELRRSRRAGRGAGARRRSVGILRPVLLPALHIPRECDDGIAARLRCITCAAVGSRLRQGNGWAPDAALAGSAATPRGRTWQTPRWAVLCQWCLCASLQQRPSYAPLALACLTRQCVLSSLRSNGRNG